MRKISVFPPLMVSVVCALGLMTGVVGAQIPASLTNGLVAYYPFDGNADDASGNGNNGTVFGATLSQNRFGFSNTAYYFNGIDNFIQVAISASLQVQQLTLSAWVQPSASESPRTQEIVAIDGFKRGYRLQDFPDFFGGAGFGVASGEWSITRSGQPLPTNAWTMMLGTYDGTNLSLYINGSLVSTLVDTAGISYSEGYPLIIGRNAYSANDPFLGSIDDIIVYDRALSSTEVTDLYNAQAVPEPSTYALLLLSGAASLWALRRRRS